MKPHTLSCHGSPVSLVSITWLSLKRRSLSTDRTRTQTYTCERGLRTTLCTRAPSTRGFLTCVTPLLTVRVPEARTRAPSTTVSKVAAQDMLETMATGALMCVPARVGRQQQSVLRSADSGCVSLTPLLLCSWQRQTELISLRQKNAHARLWQESTQTCRRRERAGGCLCCVIMRQQRCSALHTLKGQPCAEEQCKR